MTNVMIRFLYVNDQNYLKGLKINHLPQFYQKIINTWSGFIQNTKRPFNKKDVLDIRIFGIYSIVLNNKPLSYFFK